MAQVNTQNLDIESWGSPAQFLYDKDTGPNVDTRLLDLESWGSPVQFLYYHEAPAGPGEISRVHFFGI
jgi:hypothetical protein